MLRTTAQPKLSSRTRTDIPTVVDGQKYPTTLPPMTDHLITPPPELIRKWNDEAATAPMADQRYIAIQAANWGYEQAVLELESFLRRAQ